MLTKSRGLTNVVDRPATRRIKHEQVEQGSSGESRNRGQTSRVMMEPATPKLLTVAQLAKALSASPDVVYDLVRRGAVPFYRVGRSLRFIQDEVLDALRQGRSTA